MLPCLFGHFWPSFELSKKKKEKKKKKQQKKKKKKKKKERKFVSTRPVGFAAGKDITCISHFCKFRIE